MRFFALLVAVLLSACSTRAPVKGINAYHQADYKTATEVFKKAADKHQGDKDEVLFDLDLLSAAFQADDQVTAEKAGTAAMQIMWSYGGTGKGVASLVSAEALKFFKGEPFEKAMAAIYIGILNYNRGDFDNARAAFQKSLMAIKQKEPPHQEDFALGFLLLSRVLTRVNDLENAKIAFEKAKKLLPKMTFTFEDFKNSNALFLVELGYAPKKTRTGPGDSLVDWNRGKYPEKSVSLEINYSKTLKGEIAADLTSQAKTKGTTGKDVVQGTKGVLREASTLTAIIATNEAVKGNETAGWVALGAGLFAVANQSQADVRQWELLPDLIACIPAQLPLGDNTFRLSFQDSNGGNLSEFEKVWYHIPVTTKTDHIYLVRSSPVKK